MPTQEETRSFLQRYSELILISIAVLILIPLIYYAITHVFLGKTCADVDCFLTEANSCGKAKYIQEVEGTTFLLSVKNCMLTKTVKAIAQDEPPEIQDLLKGKYMTCSYEQHAFPEELATTLSKSLDSCQGTLKDAIESLLANV